MADLQHEVTSWIWDQIWSGNPEGIGDPLHAPTWSEFEVRAPGGAWAKVRVEVEP